jgi:hypothetical protein
MSAVIESAVLKSCHSKDLIKLTGLDFVVGWSTGIVTAVTSQLRASESGLVLYVVLVLPWHPKGTKDEGGIAS